MKPTPWQGLFELGARQHRVVAVHQATALGLSEATLRHRAKREAWPWPQVSVVAMPGSEATLEGQCLAAVLAAGDGSLVGGCAAARLHGLGVKPPETIVVHIAGGRGGKSLRPPAKAHRTTLLSQIPATRLAGIPVVSAAWALVDVCATMPPSEIPGFVIDAVQSRKVRIDDLEAVLVLRTRVLHRALLCQLVRDLREGIESVFERIAVPILVSRGLPRPERQVPMRTRVPGLRLRADLGYPDEEVYIELLGLTAHRTRSQIRADVRRLNTIRAAKLRVVWVEWSDLHGNPGGIVDDIRAELERAWRAGRGSGPRPFQ